MDSALSVAVRAATSTRQLAYYYARKQAQTPAEQESQRAKQRARYHANKPATVVTREKKPPKPPRAPRTLCPRPPKPLTFDPGLTKPVQFQPPPPLTPAVRARRHRELAFELRCRELERDNLNDEIFRLQRALAAL